VHTVVLLVLQLYSVNANMVGLVLIAKLLLLLFVILHVYMVIALRIILVLVKLVGVVGLVVYLLLLIVILIALRWVVAYWRTFANLSRVALVNTAHQIVTL
jgi:hypothetical protein